MRIVWKTIPNTGGFYQASENGKIRSVDRVTKCRNNFGPLLRLFKGKRLKPNVIKGGYCYVGLSISKHKKSVAVHRLVALAFHGPCPVGMECSHLNGNPKDNRPENLKWVTPKENHQHRKAHGTYPIGERNSCAILTNKQAGVIKSRLAAGDRPKDIKQDYPVCLSTINAIAQGRTWKFLA